MSAVKRMSIVAGAMILAVSLNGCKQKKEVPSNQSDADSSVVKVVTAVVKDQQFEDWGSYPADLRGADDAVLTAPFQGGKVTSVVEIGKRVRAGQPLCSIDEDKYEAAFQAAQAQVDLAKGDMDRAKINVEKGSLGRSAIDGTNLAYQNARMMLATAKRAYEDCRCVSPFDGILVSRSVENFQSVAPGMSTVRVSRIDKLEASIAIPETEAFSYTEGMKSEFTLLQDPSKVFTGTLSSVDRAVDSKTRTASARITLVNSDGLLKPGMVGRARILRKVYSSAVIVPSTALLRLQNSIIAMVVEDGIAHQRTIAVETFAGEKAVIKSGIKTGDNLITSGAFQVTEGMRVAY